MKRYNIIAPRKWGPESKTSWNLRIGVAFENDKGGLDIQLDAVPLPEVDRKQDGQMTIRLKAFDAAQDNRKPQGQAGPPPQDKSDDIPF